MSKKIYTIRFTKKSLEEFIKSLQKAWITFVIDIRLNNTSQLGGYSKGRDLEFLFKFGFCIWYRHKLQLNPPKEILNQYKKNNDWSRYEKDFLKSGKEAAGTIDYLLTLYRIYSR